MQVPLHKKSDKGHSSFPYHLQIHWTHCLSKILLYMYFLLDYRHLNCRHYRHFELYRHLHILPEWKCLMTARLLKGYTPPPLITLSTGVLLICLFNSFSNVVDKVEKSVPTSIGIQKIIDKITLDIFFIFLLYT